MLAKNADVAPTMQTIRITHRHNLWPSVMELRYKVVHELLRWRPHNPERDDTDIYDSRDDAIHLVVIDPSSQETVLGYVRLLTAEPFMLFTEESFRSFLGDKIHQFEGLKNAHRTIEATRLVLNPKSAPHPGVVNAVLDSLFCAIIALCEEQQIRYVMAVTMPSLMDAVAKRGFVSAPTVVHDLAIVTAFDFLASQQKVSERFGKDVPWYGWSR